MLAQQRFLDAILSRGGSRDALEAFIEFRGRRPDVTALLRQHGILARGGRVREILTEVRHEVGVVPVPQWNRFANSFGHIFAGGYAAGYYSYKWAEVLAADAFSAFEESGVFDRPTAQRFLDAILSRGGSRDALEAFVEFRGRRPQLDALLRQCGLDGG